MRPKAKRLTIIFTLIGLFSVGLAFILYVFNENVVFYYTPHELTLKNIPLNRTIRLGGYVKEKSLKIAETGTSFILTDFHEQMDVYFEGILPDLFAEGKGAIAEGYLIGPKKFRARQVLAKHDETYMPPSLKLPSPQKAQRYVP